MDVYNASLISDIAKECALSQLQWTPSRCTA